MRPSLSILLAAFTLLVATAANGASVSRTYAYFRVGGATLGELQKELNAAGPKVQSTGRRHPGATEMQFASRLAYAERGGRCRVSKASVTVKARIILPRWSHPAAAGEETKLVWGALSGDIKRHEESHVSIARNYARAMEQALLALPAAKSCALAADGAQATIGRLLAEHDAEQQRFDRIEMINFTDRMDRLIRYRIQQIEAGRIRN
jgi:predicted secreted Zn-dependent protease